MYSEILKMRYLIEVALTPCILLMTIQNGNYADRRRLSLAKEKENTYGERKAKGVIRNNS